MTKYYNKRHENKEFKVGDKVWLSTVNLKDKQVGPKFTQLRIGPVTIL